MLHIIHKRALVILLSLIAVFAIGLAVFFLTADVVTLPKPIRNVVVQVNNTVFQTHMHGLKCSELPTKKQAEAILGEHKNQFPTVPDLNNETRDAQNPIDYVSIYDGENYSTQKCPEKADLLFLVETRAQSVELQRMLGKDFYGIPYRIIIV